MLEVVISWWWIIHSQPIATSLSTDPAPCVTSDGRSLELVQSNSGEKLTKTETKTQKKHKPTWWDIFENTLINFVSHLFDPAEVSWTISYAEEGMKVLLSIMMVNCTVASKYIDPSVRDFIPVSLISRKKRRTSQDWSSLFPPLDDQ